MKWSLQSKPQIFARLQERIQRPLLSAVLETWGTGRGVSVVLKKALAAMCAKTSSQAVLPGRVFSAAKLFY